jgi:hypothetical protein
VQGQVQGPGPLAIQLLVAPAAGADGGAGGPEGRDQVGMGTAGAAGGGGVEIMEATPVHQRIPAGGAGAATGGGGSLLQGRSNNSRYKTHAWLLQAENIGALLASIDPFWASACPVLAA